METAPIRMSPTGLPLLKSSHDPLARYLKWSNSFNAPLLGEGGKSRKVKAAALSEPVPLAAAHDVSELFLWRAVPGSGSTSGKSSADRSRPTPRR
jgi:hypothetical protein